MKSRIVIVIGIFLVFALSGHSEAQKRRGGCKAPRGRSFRASRPARACAPRVRAPRMHRVAPVRVSRRAPARSVGRCRVAPRYRGYRGSRGYAYGYGYGGYGYGGYGYGYSGFVAPQVTPFGVSQLRPTYNPRPRRHQPTRPDPRTLLTMKMRKALQSYVAANSVAGEIYLNVGGNRWMLSYDGAPSFSGLTAYVPCVGHLAGSSAQQKVALELRFRDGEPPQVERVFFKRFRGANAPLVSLK